MIRFGHGHSLALGALSQGRAGAQEAQKQYTLFEGASIAVNIDNVILEIKHQGRAAEVAAPAECKACRHRASKGLEGQCPAGSSLLDHPRHVDLERGHLRLGAHVLVKDASEVRGRNVDDGAAGRRGRLLERRRSAPPRDLLPGVHGPVEQLLEERARRLSSFGVFRAA